MIFLKKNAFYSIIILLISYSSFYYSYKFSNPDLVNPDYYKYENMVTAPFDYSATTSPFVYRQITPFIASLIYQSGIYYHTEIAFDCSPEGQRIFFSLILSNYLGLILTMLVIIAFMRNIYQTQSIPTLFFPVFLIISSFGFLFSGLSAQAEGWTYLFNALIFYFLKKENLILMAACMLLSIFQKEISSIFFSAYAFFYLGLTYFKSKTISRTYTITLAISILSFVLYILMRTVIVPIQGFGQQLSASYWLDTLISSSLNLDFIKQGIFSVGIIFIFIVYRLWLRKTSKLKFDTELMVVFLSVISLYMIGLVTGVGNNIGRIVSSFAPVLVLSFMPYLNVRDEHLSI